MKFIDIELPYFQRTVIDKRRSICDSCENKTEMYGVSACLLCGCAIEKMIAPIYPEDADGKCFKKNTSSDNVNVCRAKKW